MRKSTIITIIIIAIFAGGIAFFMFLQKEREAQPAPVIPTVPLLQPVATSSSAQQPVLSPPSSADPNLLWLNGEWCPKKGFSIPSRKEDLVTAEGISFFVNVVEVNFTDVATCKDAEQIAVFINAKIIGFGPVTNLYAFEIPTRTVQELEAAIAKVEALNDTKIEDVSKSIPFIPEIVP